MATDGNRREVLDTYLVIQKGQLGVSSKSLGCLDFLFNILNISSVNSDVLFPLLFPFTLISVKNVTTLH